MVVLGIGLMIALGTAGTVAADGPGDRTTPKSHCNSVPAEAAYVYACDIDLDDTVAAGASVDGGPAYAGADAARLTLFGLTITYGDAFAGADAGPAGDVEAGTFAGCLDFSGDPVCEYALAGAGAGTAGGPAGASEASVAAACAGYGTVDCTDAAAAGAFVTVADQDQSAVAVVQDEPKADACLNGDLVDEGCHTLP
jgi:hypothetical protein